MLLRSFLTFLGILTVCLSGCSSVIFKHPVGQIIQDQDHLDKLGGVWSAGDSEPVTMIQPLKGGQIAIGATSWDNKQGKFVLQQYSGVVTELEGAHYINLKSPNEDADEEEYLVIRITHANDANSIVAYGLNVNTFKSAVEKGQLDGDIKSGGSSSVELTGSKDQIDNYLKTTSAGQLLDLDEPIIVHRVGEVDD